jgi:hypothetical protein
LGSSALAFLSALRFLAGFSVKKTIVAQMAGKGTGQKKALSAAAFRAAGQP